MEPSGLHLPGVGGRAGSVATLAGAGLLGSAAFFLLRPFGDFPLNDEWAYAYSVGIFLETGGLRICEAATPNVTIQAVWGSLFRRLLGPGYFPLRVSTFASAWLGAAAFYWICLRRHRAPDIGSGFDAERAPSAAGWLLLLLLFNPLWFVLSVSFMTDVPALALSLAALFLSWRGLAREPTDLRWVAAGSAFTAAAYAIRQTAVLVPLGVTLWLFFRRRRDWGALLCLWTFPLAVVLAHQIWFRRVHGLTLGHALYLRELARACGDPASVLLRLVKRLCAATVYCGLFALPLTLSYWVDRPKDGLRAARDRWPILAALGAALLAFLYRVGWPQYPAVSNYIGPPGLGCFNIVGAELRRLPALGSPWFWRVLGLVCVASFLTLLSANMRRRSRQETLFFSLPLFLEFLAPLAYGAFYDRYLLPLVPASLMYGRALAGESRRFRIAMGISTSALAVLVWSGAYDYLRVSEAAWSLGLEASRLGIAPERVLASSEWCWSHTYQARVEKLKERLPVDRISREDVLSFCGRPQAVVSFAEPRLDARPLLGSAGVLTPLRFGSERLYLYDNRGSIR